MRISEWRSDGCSSDLRPQDAEEFTHRAPSPAGWPRSGARKAYQIAFQLGAPLGAPHRLRVSGVAFTRSAAVPLLRTYEGIKIMLKQAIIALSFLSLPVATQAQGISQARSEQRRVGKACVSTCRFRVSPDHLITK